MRGSPFPVSHAAKAVPRTLALRPTNSPVGRGVRSPHRRRNRKRLRQSSNCRSRYFCVHLPCPTQVRRTRSALCRSSDLRLRGFPLRPYPAFSGLPNDWLSPKACRLVHTVPGGVLFRALSSPSRFPLHPSAYYEAPAVRHKMAVSCFRIYYSFHGDICKAPFAAFVRDFFNLLRFAAVFLTRSCVRYRVARQ